MDMLGDPDDFDSWCYSRYNRYEHSRSMQYLSDDVVGYADLDDNGDWAPAADYGAVWYPRVAAGWAPYREGHWAWIDPWGWTWVDDEPWGYAPFHYGRWAFIGGRWGWIPGPRQVMPVYAPALVVFVGGGGMAFGGNIAWFPLGPREVFVPSYHVSRGYLVNLNMSGTIVNQTVITNVYNTTIVRNRRTSRMSPMWTSALSAPSRLFPARLRQRAAGSACRGRGQCEERRLHAGERRVAVAAT